MLSVHITPSVTAKYLLIPMFWTRSRVGIKAHLGGVWNDEIISMFNHFGNARVFAIAEEAQCLATVRSYKLDVLNYSISLIG